MMFVASSRPRGPFSDHGDLDASARSNEGYRGGHFEETTVPVRIILSWCRSVEVYHPAFGDHLAVDADAPAEILQVGEVNSPVYPACSSTEG